MNTIKHWAIVALFIIAMPLWLPYFLMLAGWTCGDDTKERN